MKIDELFSKLVHIDVNDHVEKKNDLTYLSWAWAWQEFMKVCPDADYEIEEYRDKDELLKPYVYDENLGYMVFTNITACGKTRRMWLPVMDGANKAMKAHRYEYTVTKNGKEYTKAVEAATMFDINKTIMRCLVKNIAMFGLGLYIYAGEDLPTEIEYPITESQIIRLTELGVNMENLCRRFKVTKIEELSFKQAAFAIKTKEGEKNK